MYQRQVNVQSSDYTLTCWHLPILPFFFSRYTEKFGGVLNELSALLTTTIYIPQFLLSVKNFVLPHLSKKKTTVMRKRHPSMLELEKRNCVFFFFGNAGVFHHLSSCDRFLPPKRQPNNGVLLSSAPETRLCCWSSLSSPGSVWKAVIGISHSSICKDQ